MQPIVFPGSSFLRPQREIKIIKFYADFSQELLTSLLDINSENTLYIEYVQGTSVKSPYYLMVVNTEIYTKIIQNSEFLGRVIEIIPKPMINIMKFYLPTRLIDESMSKINYDDPNSINKIFTILAGKIALFSRATEIDYNIFNGVTIIREGNHHFFILQANDSHPSRGNLSMVKEALENTNWPNMTYKIFFKDK